MNAEIDTDIGTPSVPNSLFNAPTNYITNNLPFATNYFVTNLYITGYVTNFPSSSYVTNTFKMTNFEDKPTVWWNEPVKTWFVLLLILVLAAKFSLDALIAYRQK